MCKAQNLNVLSFKIIPYFSLLMKFYTVKYTIFYKRQYFVAKTLGLYALRKYTINFIISSF